METNMIIGLTGGIGSGKSAVGNEFEKLGITVIDADFIAQDAASKNSNAYFKIVDHFGTKILDEFKNINRKLLREIIFNDNSQKKVLESFLHPVIRDNMSKSIFASKSQYTIIMVPLIFETQSMDQYERILLIDCSEQLQISRASNRDNSNSDEISKILSSQATREQRLSIADDVITNEFSLAFLQQQVAKTHNFYLEITNERMS